MIIGKMTFEFLIRARASLLIGVALLITANILMLQLLDQIYKVSLLSPSPTH